MIAGGVYVRSREVGGPVQLSNVNRRMKGTSGMNRRIITGKAEERLFNKGRLFNDNILQKMGQNTIASACNNSRSHVPGRTYYTFGTSSGHHRPSSRSFSHTFVDLIL